MSKGLVPPGRSCAWMASTGRMENMPNMRSANTAASETVARCSSGVILSDVCID